MTFEEFKKHSSDAFITNWWYNSTLLQSGDSDLIRAAYESGDFWGIVSNIKTGEMSQSGTCFRIKDYDLKVVFEQYNLNKTIDWINYNRIQKQKFIDFQKNTFKYKQKLNELRKLEIESETLNNDDAAKLARKIFWLKKELFLL